MGSRLISSQFDASAGSTLTLDVAFLTNEGDPFHDYGVVALRAVPEPSSWILAILGTSAFAVRARAYPRRVRAKIHP
jgi:hypothetical protein